MNWILCPLHNGLHLTKAALKSFLAQDIGDIGVLFLDNTSQDGTTQWLASLNDPRVYMILRTEPLSVAASWNYMLSWVFGAWDHALVVNNDVELRPDTYRHLLADGGPFVTAVGRSERGSIAPPYLDPDPASKRPHPDFSCFLIRKDAYKKVGKFDEQFSGAYCEDGDYHVRLHRAGITAECLELPFYHVGAGTIKNSDRKRTREIQKRADHNRELFKAKYGVGVGTSEYYALFGHGVPL